jgi:oligopeptide transport system ATP-binding protein
VKKAEGELCMAKKLEVRGLKISFQTDRGMLQAVRDISFALEQGRTLAIVGESGSGKSVTSRAIMGILPSNAKVEGGEILCDGKDLLQLSEDEMCAVRGSKVAMIFQDPMSSLNPVMRIGKQITEAMLLRKEGKKPISSARAKEKALELMKEVGIHQPERCFYQYPFQLSGGMRQRIVIAIALAGDPEVLICDEPTTALDVTIQAQILDLIQRLKQERKLAVIFITHDLGVVARMADDIAVMYAGKIVEYGKTAEIFSTPKHPYTWALLSSSPSLSSTGRLPAIEGSPPSLTEIGKGDAFAPRNPYAMKIDYAEHPPFFKVSDTHFAATWLLHPNAPKVEFGANKTAKKGGKSAAKKEEKNADRSQ